MLSPRQYKSLYENISVPLDDGPATTVKVAQYRLAGRNYNTAAAATFLRTLASRGIDMVLQVDVPGGGTTRVDPRLTAHADAVKKGQRDLVLNTQGLSKKDTRVDTRATDWNKLARLVFAGKGSPEACQIVLQLARHWELATNLQDYADGAMGLDCNGFVGNYIWHIVGRRDWTSLGAGDHDLGPDSPIKNGYFEKYQSRLVKKWEDLDPEKLYIFMRVGDDKVVINGGVVGKEGHITITQPGMRDPRSAGRGSGSFAVYSVESTGGHTPGLCEGWYSCQGASNGVFSCYRESMLPGHEYYDFRVAAIN